MCFKKFCGLKINIYTKLHDGFTTETIENMRDIIVD